METENSIVGGTVTGEAIFELPLNGRDTLDLLATQPGVTLTNPDSARMGNYSIGGGRTDSVTYLLDGGLNNDLLSNGVVVNPNPDAIAEFRVLESTYTAEYGRNAGGIVSIVSKSGTNQFHGTIYDYVRNTDFDANDFFNNQQNLPRCDAPAQPVRGHLRRSHRAATSFSSSSPIRARSKRRCSCRGKCKPTRRPRRREISRKR